MFMLNHCSLLRPIQKAAALVFNLDLSSPSVSGSILTENNLLLSISRIWKSLQSDYTPAGLKLRAHDVCFFIRSGLFTCCTMTYFRFGLAE